jgi:hypothetical protein
LILDAVGRDLREYDTQMKVIACDPAEFGDDKTVIYVLDGLKVVERAVTSKKSTMETAGHIVSIHRRIGADKIIIDSVGVGAGVRDRVREQLDANNDRNMIVGFKSSWTARDKANYVRMRDEVWGHAAKLFKDERVSILPGDDDLVEELAAHTYSFNSKGQMCICRKVDVKKELNHSPDRADALVMGLWAAGKGKRRERVPVSAGREDNYNPLTFGLD